MKKAFSLLELVLIISILGIILSLVKFSLQKDRLLEGAEQILKDIYYVKNLARIQSAFRVGDLSVAKNEWFKSRWQLYFNSSKFTNSMLTYSIFLDKNADGNANLGKTFVNEDREMAVDILNPNKVMNYGQSGVLDARKPSEQRKLAKRFNIQKEFGIVKVEFKGACSGTTRLVFDEMGRIYTALARAKSVFDKNITFKNEKCIIRLSNKAQKSVCIVIEALSAYAYIPKFQNSHSQLINFKHTLKECKEI